jgi:hypothetical protein
MINDLGSDLNFSDQAENGLKVAHKLPTNICGAHGRNAPDQ